MSVAGQALILETAQSRTVASDLFLDLSSRSAVYHSSRARSGVRDRVDLSWPPTAVDFCRLLLEHYEQARSSRFFIDLGEGPKRAQYTRPPRSSVSQGRATWSVSILVGV